MSNTSATHGRPRSPDFGGDNGLIYPALARILDYLSWISPARFFNLPATAVDIIIIFHVLAEVSIAAALAFYRIRLSAATKFMFWVCVLIVGYRLLVIIVVNASEFFIGYSRDRAPWSFNRGIILKTVNLLEIILLYAIVYYSLEKLFSSSIGEMSESFSNILDAVYFSAVTATTLGYGDYTPKGWTLKVLVMSEVLFVLIIGLGILSFLKGRAWGPKDLGNMINDESRNNENDR